MLTGWWKAHEKHSSRVISQKMRFIFSLIFISIGAKKPSKFLSSGAFAKFDDFNLEFVKKEIIHKSDDGVLNIFFDGTKIEEHLIESSVPIAFRITKFSVGLPRITCSSFTEINFGDFSTGKLCGRRHHVSDWIHNWQIVHEKRLKITITSVGKSKGEVRIRWRPAVDLPSVNLKTTKTCRIGTHQVFFFYDFHFLKDDVRDNLPINQFTKEDLNNALKLLRKMKVSSFFSKIPNQRRLKERCSPGRQLPCLRIENGKADFETFLIDVFEKKISGCNEKIRSRWKSHFSKLVYFWNKSFEQQ